MSFELKTRLDEEEKEYEIIVETTTKTVERVKIWTKKHIQNEVIDLTEQIVEIESRITVLTEQLPKFKIVPKEIPKE